MLVYYAIFSLVLVPLMVKGEDLNSFAGPWNGGYRIGEQGQLLLLHFAVGDQGRLMGQGMIPMERANGLAIAVEPGEAQNEITFEFSWREKIFRFDGQLNQDVLAGTVVAGDSQGRFELIRQQAIEPLMLERREGVYQFDRGERLYIQTLGFASYLALCDKGGKFRALFPESDSSFVVGQGAFSPFPRQARVVFAPDQLRWEGQDGSLRRATKPEGIRRRQLRFTNGEQDLAGELLLPRGGGPHPCIIAVHGSGPQTRQVFPYTMYLVDQGYAVLGYDKRGVGESGGDWKTATFEDLAEDVLAAVHYASSQPDIRSDAVGVMGISQGGWIVAEAASRSDDIAFAISISGGAITPVEQELERVKREMVLEGFSREDIAAAGGLYRMFIEYVRTGQGWDEFYAAVEANTDKAWFSFAGGSQWPSSPDHWLVKFWAGIVNYDPLPALAKISCPVLSVLGGLDAVVPGDKTKAIWDRAINPQADYTSLFFPRANHLMLEAKTGGQGEWPVLTHYAAGYLEGLVGWLRERVPPLAVSDE